jgi:hypothetical protein
VRGTTTALQGTPHRHAWVPKARAMAACGVLALGALGLAGCAAARNELGTVQSACYLDLAKATHAVHHEGKLRGVRLVSVDSLRAHAPLLFNAGVVGGKRLGQVCLIAFGGHFRASNVEDPIGEPSGDLAIVAFGYPDRKLLATLVVTRPPLPFGHFRL